MSELITRTVVELEQLGVYHDLNKTYIDAGLAKKWESATFDAETRTVKFYTVAQPSGDVAPVFTFTLPEVDFTEINNAIDAVEEKADKNAGDIAGLRTDVDAINDEETGILKLAKDYADGKDASIKEAKDAADAAQGEIDALEEVVGAMYTNEQIDGFVADAKKAGTDANAAVEALAGTHATDKAALEAAIALKADQTALEAETKRATDEEARIEGLVTAEAAKAREEEGKLDARLVEVETFFHTAEGETIDQAMDTLVEIQKYITEDGAAADQMVKDIAANAKAIEDEVTRATGVEGGLDTRLQAVEAAVGEGGSVETQINAKLAELDADITSAEVEVGKGVRVQVVEVDGKVTNVAVTGNYDNAYDAKGAAATAKSEAIADAATDATTKANTAEANAKAHATALDEAMDARVDVVEAAIGEGGTVTTAIADAQADADEALAKLDAIKFATEAEIRAIWA